jgi:hypothetical protein
MSRIFFDPAARAELLATIKYYEECRAGLGKRFRLVVESELDLIRKAPFQFRVLHAPFRRCLLHKFPYSIIFAIEPEFILVVAVAHTKRKPGYWRERTGKSV